MLRPTHATSLFLVLLASGARLLPGAAQDAVTFWGDQVPPSWNGSWPGELLTLPERSGFSRTISSLQLLELIDAFRWRTEELHVFNLFVSPRGKAAPAMVLSRPRVASPRDAAASGKPVVYLQGKIHPPEPEATEALLMVARDILFGSRPALQRHRRLQGHGRSGLLPGHPSGSSA